MPEVFISYKSERRRAAEHMAAVLERYGYSVWFDYQLIKGRDFGLQIDGKIREAKALVALWCTESVKSRWVAEEVDLAHELDILVPVKIEPCTLRVGFRRQDYIDLSEWGTKGAKLIFNWKSTASVGFTRRRNPSRIIPPAPRWSLSCAANS
jgi:hypothetical protein